ncbi:cystatin-like [Pomacea canaliculata]|uniref:cystatin-like n=1 Tax=Pomacea canaliculata TaxID=400727 RepID=UPI000D73B598|nr:cystatin-like [Pomacea canaliculata]
MATSQLLVCAVAAVILAVVSGQLAGGISNVNLSMDAEPVTFAVDAINLKFSALAASTNDTYTPRQLVAIINAQQQVVSGMNYILTLLVAAGPQEYVCNATVWSRVWLSGPERLSITNGPECSRQHHDYQQS